MATINLLPEVRVIKLKSAHNKRLATTLTILLGLVLAGIIVGLIVVIGYYAGESRLRDNQAQSLKRDVDKFHTTEEQATTVQQHLASFSNLNSKRIAVTAVFSNFVKTIPPQVSISSFDLNENYEVSVSGTADSYKTLGVFTKALEDYNTSFKPQTNLDKAPIFSNVAILQSNKDATTNSVSFSMSFSVDKKIAQANLNQVNQ